MLGRLLRYDLKEMRRRVIPSAAVLAAALLTLLCSSNLADGFDPTAVAAYFYAVAMLSFIFTVGGVAYAAVKTFKECVDSDRAFMIMALPVNPALQVVSKLICTVIFAAAFSVVWYAVIVTGAAGGLLRAAGSDLTLLITPSQGFKLRLLDAALTILCAELFLFAVIARGGRRRSEPAAALICGLGAVIETLLSFAYRAVSAKVLGTDFGLYIPLLGFYGAEDAEKCAAAMCVYHGALAAVFFIAASVRVARKFEVYG